MLTVPVVVAVAALLVGQAAFFLLLSPGWSNDRVLGFVISMSKALGKSKGRSRPRLDLVEELSFSAQAISTERTSASCFNHFLAYARNAKGLAATKSANSEEDSSRGGEAICRTLRVKKASSLKLSRPGVHALSAR